MACAGPERRRSAFLVTTLVFVASRWFYRNVLRLEFDASPLDSFIQYMDPWFMEHDFARSLLYLHDQGPLLNLLVGAALRLFGKPVAFAWLEALFSLACLATVLGLLEVALRLGARARVACLVACVYAILPSTVFYEKLLFYHTPVACCLVLAVLFLVHYYRAPSFGAAFACFSAIALAALFRSTFGPSFLLAALLFMLKWPPLGMSSSLARRGLLRAAALPFLLLCLNNLKPLVLLGYGYGDAMLWGNLATKVSEQLSDSERARLIERGAVSRAVNVFCFADLREFGEVRVAHARTGVPLLDEERAPNGRWNAHALEYLLLADAHFKPNALYLLSHYPDRYVSSVRKALRATAGSSITDEFLPYSNSKRLRASWAKVDRLLMLQKDGSFTTLSVGLPLLFAYGLWRAVRTRAPSQRGITIVLSFVLLTVAYATAVSVLISYGAHARYRFEIDPLLMLLLALGLSELRWPRLLRARAALGRPPLQRER
jgi:hypothetical protein